METKLLIHSINTATGPYTVKRKTVSGKNYVIVPVVMMLEGVHSGSAGPILHTATALSASAQSWNGTPVVIHHPQDENGNFISANSTGVTVFGDVKNCRWEDNKLKGDAWLEETKLIAHYPLVLNMLSNGTAVDVSIGAYTTELIEAGEWNGEIYQAITESYIPDHLAILPGEEGACNWEDGCGIRANKRVLTNPKNNENMTNPLLDLKQVNAEGFAIYRISNSMSLSQLERVLRDHVNGMDNEEHVYYLQDIYDDFFIYEKNVRWKEGQATRPQPVTQLMRQEYTINGDNVVEITGDPVEVSRKVTYVPITTITRTKFNTNSKSNPPMEKPSACLLKKVNDLIANSSNAFTEEDRDWLLLQPEHQLAKFLPTPVEQPQVNLTVIKEFLQTNTVKQEELLAALPQDIQDSFNKGAEVLKAHRTSLIDSIKTNSKEGVFTEEELHVMPTEMLDKLSRSLQPVDYSAKGAAAGANPINPPTPTTEADVLLPTGYGAKK